MNIKKSINKIIFATIAVVGVALLAFNPAAPSKLQVKKGAHIILVGNNLGSRMMNFGYFETEKDHVSALKAFRKGLKHDGTLVIDYFNTQKIIKNLTNQETKTIDGIEFHLHKFVSEGKIIKHINFEHRLKDYAFEERVQAFFLADFERMLTKSGLMITETFGNYNLDAFDEIKSDRLILVCKKA